MLCTVIWRRRQKQVSVSSEVTLRHRIRAQREERAGDRGALTGKDVSEPI